MTEGERGRWNGDVGQLAIRRLGAADLGDCLILAGRRQWPPEESKWRFLLGIGCALGVDDPVGGLAGAVVLTRYQDELAAIGMLLVAPRFGRLGLGRRLMTAALDQASPATVLLYTTAAGRPLYDALGFREVGQVVKYAGQFRPGRPAPGTESTLVRPAMPADLPDLIRLDAVAFGARRERLLTGLDQLAALRLVAGPSDGLTGYGAAWPSLGHTVIGPLIAADDGIAEALLAALASQSGGALSLDLPIGSVRLARWAEGHGLREAGQAALMVASERDLPGARDQLFAPVMQALG